MRPLTKKAREALDSITAAFDDPERLVDTIKAATLIPNDSPCRAWSRCNRFLVALSGSGDCRGFKQWKKAGRTIRKGAKAVFILVPRYQTSKKDEEEEDERRLIGFVAAPVFRYEDSKGAALPGYEPVHVPKLQVVADTLGIPVNYAGAVSLAVLGAYRHDDNPESGAITLFSHDIFTHAHEISHALHHRIGKLRQGKSKEDRIANETVAEISAAVLVDLFEGKQAGRQAIGYVKAYDAKKAHLMKVLPEIIEVVDLAIEIGTRTDALTIACEG